MARVLVLAPVLSPKLDDIEREHILSSLQYFNGNKSKTSTALG